MEPWLLALILKPLIVLAFFALYYAFVIIGLRKLYDLLPKNKLVDALFRERGNCAPSYGPGYLRNLPDRPHDRSLLPRR